MPSRRIFLQRGAGTIGAFLFAPSCFALRRDVQETRKDLALRLFFDDADLGRMRRIYETDLAFESLRRRLGTIDRSELRSFIKNDVRYNDQLFHIIKLSDAAQEMGLHYLLSGDRDAAELAAECIRSIMQFERWDYFLEAGNLVVGIQRASSTLEAVAVCSDWLGDYIAEDERAGWLTVMKERGCEPCFRSIHGMRFPDTVSGWTRDESSTYFEHRPGDRPTDLSNRHIILDSTNLKAVPASALAIGAMAYRQQFGSSAETERWTEQAVYSIGTFGAFFAADGSYHEGVSYADYTALNLLKATSILKRFDVADLTELINWSGYADFAVGMSMATDADPYEIVNFGDNGNAKSDDAGKPKRTAVSLWIGANNRDPRAQWFGLNLGGEHDEWALIWYDPTVDVDAPADGPQLWHSDLDWIVARTGYAPDDLTVAMRSGGPGNHEHADRNSIVVKCYGEQLVADPYRPPYSFTDPRWMMRTTAGHSAVMIDGKGHQYHDGTEGTNASMATAHIIRKTERKGYACWTSDATAAYRMVNADIDRITRTVIVLYQFRDVIVFDKVLKKQTPSTIEARYFGFNYDGAGGVTADGLSSFLLKRPSASMAGSAIANIDVRSQSLHLPIPEDEAVKHPFAAVSTITPNLNPTLITVLSPSEGPKPTSRTIIKRDGNVYRISITRGMIEFRCHIVDTGMVPEFAVGWA